MILTPLPSGPGHARARDANRRVVVVVRRVGRCIALEKKKGVNSLIVSYTFPPIKISRSNAQVHVQS